MTLIKVSSKFENKMSYLDIKSTNENITSHESEKEKDDIHMTSLDEIETPKG
jgi:hypothetical protein